MLNLVMVIEKALKEEVPLKVLVVVRLRVLVVGKLIVSIVVKIGVSALRISELQP